MKEKTMIIILALAILFLTFYTSFAYASLVDGNDISTPILIEAMVDDGQILLIYFYPNSETICFTTLMSRVCMDTEGISKDYLDFVHNKVSNSRH